VPLFQEQLLRMAMTVAGFTGAEAEQLRRAVGMRRSWERMKNLEGRLREGMTRNGLDRQTQDTIVQNISSFALYGFPESHAASFALLAYASAYFKVNYLAAFTCAMLNNQPMGFYSPAVLVKDAQRHGLKVSPVDVQRSGWLCTLEGISEERLAGECISGECISGECSPARHPQPQKRPRAPSLSLRLGLCYGRGLARGAAEELVAERQRAGLFGSVEELAARVPALGKKNLLLLARIGALNGIGGVGHRRDALWQIERAARREGPLLGSRTLEEQPAASPLPPMSLEERLVADYAGLGLTVGRHPMAHRRAQLGSRGVRTAAELRHLGDGEPVRVAGCVIARQRPGTARGFLFLSLEDETGIANVIVTPQLYERDRRTVTRSRFLLAAGRLQNQDGVIHVKAETLAALEIPLATASHDFH
jgi:error-prone DNA polymerase